MPCSYTYASENLNLDSLRKQRHEPHAATFIQVYRVLNSRTSLLENISLRFTTRYVTDFSMFILCSSANQSGRAV
jgi:hypothetical protein